MDERKIEIIIHATNEDFLAQLIQSLETVVVPENFFAEVEVIGDGSKYEAYNAAMQASDAKYKIYLDERAVITNKNFLVELLEIFDGDKKIGAVGTSGALELSTSGVSFYSEKWKSKNYIGEAQVVDGFFFATQYDLPWREDLFKDNFFGGQAQCVEFKRAGYKVFIGGDWIFFDTDTVKLDEASRNIFLNEYSADLFPLVTILIPTFNRPKWFKEALESALNQTYRNIEIIISDDSTNDDTEKLIQSYLGDPRIKYFRNRGFTITENWNFLRGYNNPAAEYVNWLMDDDIFYPTKLEKMIEVYRNNPDISLVTSSRNFIDADGNIIGSSKNFNGNQNLKVDGDEAGRFIFFVDNYIGETTTVLIRKKFLRDNDLCWNEDENTDSFPLSDVSTWLQLLTQGNMFRLAECLSSCRIHSGQDGKQISTIMSIPLNYTKLFKTAVDKKVFFHNEKDLRLAIFFLLGTFVGALSDLLSKDYYSKRVETLEKTFVALTQSLFNGYKFELPPME